jgi:SPW repeat
VSRLAAAVAGAMALAPWLLGFSDRHAAVAGGIAFAMTVAPVALLAQALPAAAYATVAAGAWLVASPWALGYASPAAVASATLAGALLAAAAVAASRHRRV